jgi:hypothetical protein
VVDHEWRPFVTSFLGLVTKHAITDRHGILPGCQNTELSTRDE